MHAPSALGGPSEASPAGTVGGRKTYALTLPCTVILLGFAAGFFVFFFAVAGSTCWGAPRWRPLQTTKRDDLRASSASAGGLLGRRRDRDPWP